MPPPKSDVHAPYRTLRTAIESGAIGNLYLFHGEEDYLRDFCVREMKSKLVSGSEAFNLHVLTGKEADLSAISAAVDCLPMLNDRTLVLVYDFDLFRGSTAEQKKMLDFLAQLPDYCCLVFIYDLIPYKPDARTKLAAFLKDQNVVVPFLQQEQNELVLWIRRRFRALGHRINPSEAEYLLFLCGGLMTSLVSEIEKIGAYAKEEQITRADIDAVASPVLDAVVWQMTDAISKKEFSKALSITDELLRMGESPILILAALGRQLRRLYSARLAIRAGKDSSYLASLWGMRSSYPANLLLSAARRFSDHWCRKSMVLAAQTDLAMKFSRRDGEELLIELLLHLSDPSFGTTV